jgi:hypothetical protein
MREAPSSVSSTRKKSVSEANTDTKTFNSRVNFGYLSLTNLGKVFFKGFPASSRTLLSNDDGNSREWNGIWFIYGKV